MTMSPLRVCCFIPFRYLAFRAAIAVVLAGSLLPTASCDFVVNITVRNRSSLSIIVDINDRGQPGVVEPGEDAQFGTGINNALRTIRITTPSDPSIDIVKSFTRNSGYNVFVTVTGPPLQIAVETRSFGKATPAEPTPTN